MSPAKAAAIGTMLLNACIVSSCRWVLNLIPDEDRITHVAGQYYTAAMDNTGTSLHWYQDGSHLGTEPLLEAIYDTQLCGKYLVARAGTDFYVLYPIQVQSIQEAQQKRQGPFEKKELMQTLLSLTGDTTLHQTGNF